MRCTIVPPHILQRIATSADDPALRDIARRSLLLDASQRTERRITSVVSPMPTGDFKPHRTIMNAKNGEELPGETMRSEGAPATGDTAADQAYDWLGATFDFYEAVYRRDSIDGGGMPMISTVHYAKNYDNAFWNGSQMVYGDGDGTLFTAFTGPLDVTGHELTHGVTQHAAGLDYYGQSGALNESISDVFGSLIKQHHLGQTADQADWLIGAGLLAESVHGVALRSMKAPGTAYDDPRLGTDPQPGHMKNFVQTYRDNGGVHINSGIPNRAFYLVSAALGGNAWERAGKVWYETLTGGTLSSTVEFEGFAQATLATATRLFGEGGTETGAVHEAWKEVGVLR